MSVKSRSQLWVQRGITVHGTDYHSPVLVHNADLLPVGRPAHASNHWFISIVDHFLIPRPYFHKKKKITSETSTAIKRYWDLKLPMKHQVKQTTAKFSTISDIRL